MSVADPVTLSLEQSVASLFPLPLTPFETFMVEDDTREYPMMADLEMQVQGRVDRGAFESALKYALERNPLFTCLLARDAKGRLAWAPSDQRPEVEWVAIDAPLDDRYGAYVDLFKNIGLRIWVRAGEDRSAILLHFHHACSDGIGAFGFFEDLLTGYALAYPGAEPVTPRKIEPERLRHRGEIGLDGRNWKRKLVDALAGAREGIKFFIQLPASLGFRGVAASKDTAPVTPGFITRSCSSQVSAGLRREASACGATVNDVLLRDLFVTLRRWNAKHDPRRAGRNLRILMPQNLRERADNSMPAANVMSFAFVTRRPKWCDRPQELLSSIHEETEAVRRGKLSLYFTGALASLQSAGLMRLALRTPMCFATAVLTNLSDPTRRFTAKFPRGPRGLTAGNLVMQAIVGTPPLRSRTHAAFCVSNSSDTMFISLKWDARHCSSEEARQLLDRYIEELEQTASPAALAAPPPARESAVQ